MTLVRKPKSAKPLVLTERMEEILKLVYFYRYITAVDMACRLNLLSSLNYVRDVLSRLAGGADYQTGQYLYRFPLPRPSTGGSERVYTLGARGRDFLAHELHLPVDWYFRPGKVRHLSAGQLTHDLFLTRFMVAAHVWCASKPEMNLSRTRTCYELGRVALPRGKGKRASLPAIPDAWLLFERLTNGERERSFPILLEIDRGTQYRERFKRHIESRLEFVRSGTYKELFGIKEVVVAYVTTGQRPEYLETRLRSMCSWTQETLRDLRRENWASMFRFYAVLLEDLYKAPLFSDPVWYRSDSPEPTGLFAA